LTRIGGWKKTKRLTQPNAKAMTWAFGFRKIWRKKALDRKWTAEIGKNACRCEEDSH